jgi:hypothetical protein
VIVALASRTASPGVTTLATLIAANWDDPEATRLVVEADPAGGSLAARWSAVHGVTWDPGLLDISTIRSDLADPRTVAAVSQPLADNLWLVAAPPAPEQVRAALTRLGDPGAAAMARAQGLCAIVDCGRLTSRSPALPIAQRAVLTLLVCRPRLDEIYTMAPAVEELRDAGCNPMLGCIGDRPYQPTDVSRALRIELLGVVPDDRRAAEEIRVNGLAFGRAYRRSQLASSVRELTSVLQARTSELLHSPDLSSSRSTSQASTAPGPSREAPTSRPVPPSPPANQPAPAHRPAGQPPPAARPATMAAPRTGTATQPASVSAPRTGTAPRQDERTAPIAPAAHRAVPPPPPDPRRPAGTGAVATGRSPAAVTGTIPAPVMNGSRPDADPTTNGTASTTGSAPGPTTNGTASTTGSAPGPTTDNTEPTPSHPTEYRPSPSAAARWLPPKGKADD